MSFQFVNNWPYSDTTFPTMIDHVDPVNETYFTGLMTEIGRIEYYLGANPQGSYKDLTERLAGFDFVANEDYTALVNLIQINNDYIWDTLNPAVAEDFADVKDKLETHGHTGGTDGVELSYPTPGVWQSVGFVGTPEFFTVDPFNVGTSYAGFAYYNFVYLGPCVADAGPQKIRSFNTLNDETFWQDSIGGVPVRGAIPYNEYGIFTLGGSPGSIIRFNPLTWEQILTSLGAGNNFPTQLWAQDSNVWTPAKTSPTRLVRYTPATHAVASWALDAGENECDAICGDGTYIWTCCNTNPVKLIRFKISDKSHTAFTLTGFLGEVKYMTYIGGLVYMFSDNVTVQWARFNPNFLAFQRFTPDFPYPFRAGQIWNNKILLTTSDASNVIMVLFQPTPFTFWLTDSLGAVGPATGLTVANNHAVWPGEIDENYDWEAPLTDPS